MRQSWVFRADVGVTAGHGRTGAVGATTDWAAAPAHCAHPGPSRRAGRARLAIAVPPKCHHHERTVIFHRKLGFTASSLHILSAFFFFSDIFSSLYFVSIMQPAIGVKQSCQT